MNQDITSLIETKENVMVYLNEVNYKPVQDNIKDNIDPTNIKLDDNIEFNIAESKQFNIINENLYVNLIALFDKSSNINKLSNSHIAINKSIISNMKITIDKLDNILSGIEKTLEQKSNPIHHIEIFKDNENIENNLFYYKERYGEFTNNFNIVSFDKNEECLTLPVLNKENMLINNNGNILASLLIKYQTGKNIYSYDDNSNLINAIDTSPLTFWHQTILTDTPIKIQFDDKYYNIKNGALCELELNFESKTMLNEITLEPFVMYPIEILGIRYKETDDDKEEIKSIVHPNNIYSNLKNKVTDKSISYKFENIICKKMYIIFRQIHYTKFTNNYNIQNMFKNKLWYNLINEKIDIKDELFKPMNEEKNINNKLYEYLSKSSIKEFDNSIFDKLFETINKTSFISKIQYDYGFYNISTYLNDFDKTGIYVSNIINVESNISAIKIYTDEVHPEDAAGKTYTDIEYYITTKENPKVEDWISILPQNKNEIKSELLQKVLGKFNLRFKATQIIDVYFNNIPLKPNVDYYTNIEDTGYITSIEIPNSDPFSSYTIDYIPVKDFNTLNVTTDNFDVNSTEESIFCTGLNYYRLSNIPIINRESNIKLSIVNTDNGDVYSEENGYIVNITNTINPKESYKNFKKGTLIQYYIEKNYIYLNQEFTSPFMLVISYDNYISSFRLKAIFRKNVNNSWLTPTLSKIDYEIETL